LYDPPELVSPTAPRKVSIPVIKRLGEDDLPLDLGSERSAFVDRSNCRDMEDGSLLLRVVRIECKIRAEDGP
jgi:hypothetical protein